MCRVLLFVFYRHYTISKTVSLVSSEVEGYKVSINTHW